MTMAGAWLMVGSAIGAMLNQYLNDTRHEKDVVTESVLPLTRSRIDSKLGPSIVERYGLPSNGNLRRMEGFVASVNYERRIPNWVMEHLEPSPRKGDGSREGSQFFPDSSVPEMFRATNSDYSVPGLSRGHLAAAQFHKRTQTEMNETFNLSVNIIPQDMTVNGCDWYRLESMTKKLSREFDGLWVVSGPMFVPKHSLEAPGERIVQYSVIGEHDVAVPTHLFKCLLGVTGQGTKGSACFVLPNAPIVEERPLTQFKVDPSFVERVTGLQLFPALGGLNSRTTYDMCSRHKCEGSYGSFSKSYRNVGRIRSAKSAEEATRVFQSIVASGTVDANVEKELTIKLQQFAK
jgi:DNA/RNA endonuclease G (NUC1)